MSAVDRRHYAVASEPAVREEQRRKNEEFLEGRDGSDDDVWERVIAYRDKPQPIGWKATISAPHMHAIVLELLTSSHLDGVKDVRILDVGCGSGYLAAVFGRIIQGLGLGGCCIGIDYIPELVALSEANMRRNDADLLEEGTVRLRTGDGWQGAPEDGPYHAIHVGAGAAAVPDALVDQLAAGGRMVVPVDNDFVGQDLILIKKDEEGKLTETKLMGVFFVPLVDVREAD